MVERKSELKRRYHRKAKLRKLKAKLAAAKDGGKKQEILKKIHVISPWWLPAGAAPTHAAHAAPAHAGHAEKPAPAKGKKS
jgi:hypothetical protein